tara:strand:+ start:266 stop:2308 length:2043 start_codon:yes stop_codon:yes gene_type:complete
MSAEVFISYASNDKERVLEIVDRLRDAGVSVWIDQGGIEGATMWSQEIVEAIDDCKVMLLAISSSSTESKNVIKELALASERQKSILPICLEDSGIPKSMEYQLAGIQRVEYLANAEDAGHAAALRALAKLGVSVNANALGAAGQPAARQSHGSSKAENGNGMKIAAAVVGLLVAAWAVNNFSEKSPDQASHSNPENNATQNPFAGKTPESPKPSTNSLDTNRVVVLPFKTIGRSGETADLGYGLVSTLTSKLQPLQSLVVIAKESARKFKETELSPNGIGNALNAGSIVTGEIQTDDTQVQVNIQLINANTEALGWAQSFNQPKTEFLKLQNEIATALATKLKGELAESETQHLARMATEIPEAHREYQAGRREWNRRTKEGFAAAIKHFERALELDPDFADAYSGLADTYGLHPSYNIAPSKEAMPKAKTYALKAIELNPTLAEAHTSLAWVQGMYEFDWEKAEQTFLKASQLNPNYATAHQWLGFMLMYIDRSDEAVLKLTKALELDPTSLVIPCNLADAYMFSGQKDKARQLVANALKIDPYFSYAIDIFTTLQDDPKVALAKITEAIKVRPDDVGLHAASLRVHIAMGNQEAAKDALIYLMDNYVRIGSASNINMAASFAYFGEYERALSWMQRAVETRETGIVANNYSLWPKAFIENPRFRELMQSISHPNFHD